MFIFSPMQDSIKNIKVATVSWGTDKQLIGLSTGDTEQQSAVLYLLQEL